MNLWEEVFQIASSLILSTEDDSIIWNFDSSGKYSAQSLYDIVNDRGIKQLYTLVTWKIKVPPRIHIFLWLLANNRILTRDNLAKRREVQDKMCLFCSENESVNHLFFDCCVARQCWAVISEILQFEIGMNFESVGRCWINNKKMGMVNMLTSVVLWSLWKLRNALCFKEERWIV